MSKNKKGLHLALFRQECHFNNYNLQKQDFAFNFIEISIKHYLKQHIIFFKNNLNVSMHL